MIELKRLKLINWHNFENVTFDCARLTYMIGVNAVGKTTILDAIRYCLTTNRNFNALGNKKSGRTLQGSVHAKQRGENAYRRPGRTVAYIGAEFWDSVKRTHFVIAVRVESEGPMQELHPGDQTWYISEDGCTLEQLPFIDPRTGAPSSKENFKPAVGRLSYTRSPGEARDRICRALGIGRAASPLGKKFNEVFQMGTSMDEIPNFREFLYQYILPQPELDLEALQGDRVELENLHAVLAEAQTRAAALEQIVGYGREAAQKETEALVNRGTALLARAEEAAAGTNTWQEHLAAGKRQHEELTARYAAAKDAEAEARRAYLSAHSAAASGEGRALDALSEELARKKTALDKAGRDASRSETAAGNVQSLLQSLQRSGFAVEKSLWPASLTAETLPQLQSALAGLEKPLEEQYFAARQSADALTAEVQEKQAELASVSGGRWVYPHGDAATRVRDAVNAELKSRGMTPDAKIFCELLSVEDESWQDCVEACLGDRRFDILVPPAHYAAAKSAFVALRDKVGPISLLEPGYEDLTGLYPHDENQAGQMFSYFGAQYLTTVNLVVPEEYRSLAETIKQQIERQPRPTVNLEVLSDEDYAKRIKDGKWELTVMSMDGTDDAGIFADPDSMFHYDHTEAQQAYADARAATNDADYEARMKAYARLISEDAASDWLYTRKCFTVASTKVSGYPTSMINRRMPLAGLTVK